MASSQDSWIKDYQSSILSLDEFLKLVELEDLKVDIQKNKKKEFPFKVTRQFAKRIKKRDPNDPLFLQIVSKNFRAARNPDFSNDPLLENNLNTGLPLLKKYEGRALLLLTGSCAIHCRYCFRQKFSYSSRIGSKKLFESIKKIKRDHSIKEVILSGGEPLTLTDQKLKDIVKKISSIDHIKTIRFHTRMPIVYPARITDELCLILSQSKKNIVMVIHTNHANELDSEVATSLKKLKQHDFFLLNQSVLLRNVNDNLRSLEALSEKLFTCGVIPYYMHFLDKITGAERFEVSLQRAKKLRIQLVNRLPNYLVPKFVREIPGEKAKVQI